MAPHAPPTFLVLLLRVYLGAVFLVSGALKLASGDFASRMTRFLETVIGASGEDVDPGLPTGFSWYRPFLEEVVIPNAELFASLVMAAEFAAGVALVLGVGTRLAAATGFVLLVNYSFAWGALPWSQRAERSPLDR